MRYLFFVLLFVTSSFATTNLTFYCGITMVPAIMEAKADFEKSNDCKIRIIQGGSVDLLKSVASTETGDLLLPGKDTYIDKFKSKGYIYSHKFIGCNRLAIFVRKGNPKMVKGLKDLTRLELVSVLGNPLTSSIGKMAEDTLLRYGGIPFLERVKYSLGIYAADSRDMNALLGSGRADIGLNWITSLHNENLKDKIEIIDIADFFAPLQRLEISVLSFSRHKKLSQAFVDYLVLPKARSIISNYGFIVDE